MTNGSVTLSCGMQSVGSDDRLGRRSQGKHNHAEPLTTI